MHKGVVKEYYELLRLVVDHGAYPVVIVDASGIVQMTNPAADRLFSRPSDDLVGETFPFDVSSRAVSKPKIVHAEDGTWSAEMHVAPTNLNSRKLYVVSLRYADERSPMNGALQEAHLADQTTGLLNLQGFTVLTDQQLRLSRRSGRGLLLVVADIDSLACIHEEHGVDVGDLASRQAGMLMKQAFRGSDIVGRIGENTFAVTAIDARRDSGGILVARLRDTFWDFNANSGSGYQLSISTGIGRFDPVHPVSMDALMAEARGELEACRASGKGQEDGDDMSRAG